MMVMKMEVRLSVLEVLLHFPEVPELPGNQSTARLWLSSGGGSITFTVTGLLWSRHKPAVVVTDSFVLNFFFWIQVCFCFWSAVICSASTWFPETLKPKRISCTFFFPLHSWTRRPYTPRRFPSGHEKLKYLDPFSRSYKTSNKTTALLLQQGMSEVLSQPSAIVLCRVISDKLSWEQPLARHTAEKEGAAWWFHSNSFSSFLRTSWPHASLREEEVLAIFSGNNCLISSHNTHIAPFDGLMVSGLVMQCWREQGHYASLFRAPISETQANLLTFNFCKKGEKLEIEERFISGMGMTAPSSRLKTLCNTRSL